MSQKLPPVLRRPLVAVAICAAALAVASCSSGSGSAASDSVLTSTEVAVSPSAPSATPSPTASIHLTVGLDLPSTWLTRPLAADGEGYGMTLAATSDPDLFDGHFFRREPDGAVTDQHVITVFVTSPTEVIVTWPDGTKQPGTLSGGDGTDAELNLAPGCVAFLADGGTDADCVLIPESDSASIAPPDPQTVPTTDEAMSYLCSVGVDELTNVVDSSSDLYSTSVLQAALTTLGYDPGAVDGHYGQASRAAVREFQTQAGLAVDAKVGPRTWTALQAAACQVPEDPAERGDEQPSD